MQCLAAIPSEARSINTTFIPISLASQADVAHPLYGWMGDMTFMGRKSARSRVRWHRRPNAWRQGPPADAEASCVIDCSGSGGGQEQPRAMGAEAEGPLLAPKELQRHWGQLDRGGHNAGSQPECLLKILSCPLALPGNLLVH